MSHALGIDVGSTNAKVALVDADGTVVATAARPIVTRRDGPVAEQDPAELWAAVVEATREVTSAAPDAAAQVTDIGTCSQYSSIVGVDAAGEATTGLVMYLDQRGTDHSWAIIERHPDAFGTWLERHGIPPVGGGLALAHLLHLQHDRPEAHAATSRYLEPMDFVDLRLTGRAAANQCTMFMAQLCDNRTTGVTSYDPELLEMSGVDATRLPPLLPVGEAVGTLLPEVAATLGLPDGVVVQGAVNDSHAGAIGSGAFAAGRAGVMIGTTSVLLDTTDGMHSTDLDHEVLSMPSPFDGEYLVWAENGLGGKALEHLLVEVIHAVDPLADHHTDDHFRQLDAALTSVPAGSGGVLFLPWLAGSFSPDANPKMRGAFLNLSLDTGRTHLVRAAVEGICHNLAWLLPFVEGFTGADIDHVTFGGGAARSPVWGQILANTLDRPVELLADPDHVNARAMGLLALHRSGTLTRTDLAERVRTTATYTPGEPDRSLYRAMNEQFVASFEALQPIYESLNG